MMLEILHRYTKAVLYKSDSAETVRQAAVEALGKGADLSGAYLRSAYLSGADLSGANLSGAYLSGADLSGANLSGAYLRSADLSGADLRSADLCSADLCSADLSGAYLRSADLRSADLCSAYLRSADLSGAYLSGADLSGANLCSANLCSANLSGADLCSANLSGAKDISSLAAAKTTVAMPEGLIVGWKKCSGGVIVKLHIPAEARRSNATGRKCRAEFADVVEVLGGTVGISLHDNKTQYVVGARVTCHEWCEDRWNECAGGIHFFITREEAEAY